jgi:hypothetical protein
VRVGWMGKGGCRHVIRPCSCLEPVTTLIRRPFEGETPPSRPSKPSVQKNQTQSIHLKILVLSPRHSTGISPHSKTRQNTESNRQRLLRPDGTWDAGASKDNTGKKSQLDAVGLLVGDPVGAQRVQGADGAAGGHRGHAAGAYVAGNSAAGRQGGEEVADLDERLGGESQYGDWLSSW